MKRYIVSRGKIMFAVHVHPCPESEQIIINVPGYKGDIDGYNDKYRKIGERLSKKGVAAFVQMPNIVRDDDPDEYCRELNADVIATCHDVRRYARNICGAAAPSICLAGFSAGGAAVASVAHAVSAKKVLLMEPSVVMSIWEDVSESLRNLTGDLYMVTGSGPEAIGPDDGRRFYDLAPRRVQKGFHAIPDCDHQFKGTRNGQIMAKAFEWAFAGDTTFPSPEGGLVLY